jgi:hypothetical protein
MAIKFLNTVQVDTDVLYVDAANNKVGIGITTPRTKLHVFNTVSSLPSLGDAGSAAQLGGNSFGTQFSTLTSGKGVIQQGRSDGTATSYDLLLQPSGGDVGINDASPSYKLDVDGEGRFTGDLRCLSLIQTSQSDKKESIAVLTFGKSVTVTLFTNFSISVVLAPHSLMESKYIS